MFYRIKKDYSAKYDDPLILRYGDIVRLGRKETEEKWKGWIWAVKDNKEGWIPLNIMQELEDGTGKILRDYSGKELSVSKGERVTAVNEESGWLWVRNSGGNEGWIPKENAKEVENHLGRISLAVSVAGLVVTEALIRAGVAEGPAIEIINAGFEGGTVGGLADWFAVSALFKEIPIPYIRRHTNIIVKNRGKISEGIVDLVTNKWLSPDVLAEKLEAFDFSDAICNMLEKKENVGKLNDFLRNEVLSKIASGIDSPGPAEFLEGVLKEQVSKLDLAKPLGKWLKKTIESGSHNDLIERLLQSVSKSLGDPDFRRMLEQKLDKIISEYKSSGMGKDIFITVAEGLKIIDRDMIAAKIQNGLRDSVEEIASDPSHEARQKLDSALLKFADGLISGDSSSVETAENLRNRLLENAELGSVIRDLLTKARNVLDSQIKDNDTALMRYVTAEIEKAVKGLRDNDEAKNRLNKWIRESAIQLINQYHPEIGNMVRGSLDKLDDRNMVRQIEEKVWNDLQFIRLNGAVIGFFAGAVIKIIKISLS